MSNDREEDDAKSTYSVSCHCGAVRGTFRCSSTHMTAYSCNCSDCFMRNNTRIIVHEDQFTVIDCDDITTTLYEWGKKRAKRRFCKTCGILPWYRLYSKPDHIGVTLNCIDWGDASRKPKITFDTIDGASF